MNEGKKKQAIRFSRWRGAIGPNRHAVQGVRGIVILAALSAWILRAGDATTIIAIPPSPVLANFCGDVAELHPEGLEVIVYPSRGNPEGSGLHRWDLARWRWQRLEWKRWMAGNAWPDGRNVVLVVKLSSNAADSLVDAAKSWAAKIEVIDGYGLHEVANALNAHLRFSPGQWQYLARRHDLVLVDRNYERRRYGRFGKPGEVSHRRNEDRPASRALQDALREAEKVAPGKTGSLQGIPTKEKEEEGDEPLVPIMHEEPEEPKRAPSEPLETPEPPDAAKADAGDGLKKPSPTDKVLVEEDPEPTVETPASFVNQDEPEIPAPPAPPPGLEEALQPEDEQYWKTPPESK